jgi:YidC/Oxa1 family membrane protein insertase
MERRLILALTLSFLVLLISSRLVTKPVTPPQPQIVSPKEAPAIEALTKSPQEMVLSSEFEYKNRNSRIIFLEPQAAIKEIIFDSYQSYKFPLKYSLLVGDQSLAFKRQLTTNNEVIYSYGDKDKNITKHFLFSNTNYDIMLEIKIQNISAVALTLKLPLILGVINFTPNRNRMIFQDVTVAEKEKISYPNIRNKNTFNYLKFIGLRDRYFCAIIEPKEDNYSGFINKTVANESEVGIVSPELLVAPGAELKQKFHIYLGPQDLKIISAINPDWQPVIYYGKFDFIAQMLLKLLKFFFNLVHNWGWAITILSLAIYIILYPLTLKQMKSMKEMQILQPQIEELRQLYKDNTQRLNKEIMVLYRKHKVNPFGGCLPLILQIPIFFALYQVLSRSIALKGANFLWIKDLSEPDRLFQFPVELPFLGQYFNLLPILMAIGMFIQQKSSIAKMSGSAAEQQKIMIIIFPIMFGILFYNMPAGLVLYWFINSSLTLGYQLLVARAK